MPNAGLLAAIFSQRIDVAGLIDQQLHLSNRHRQGPAVMATLRNLAIGLHRRAGAHNIATACRTVSRHPARALIMII